MIPPSGIELTRVYYYDQNKTYRNMEISTISREVYENNLNRNVIIKRNVFGHKWILQINPNREIDKKDGSGGKFLIYIWLFCCIVVAISFGIYSSLDGGLQGLFKNRNILVPKIINTDSSINENSVSKTSEILAKGQNIKIENYYEVANTTTEAINVTYADIGILKTETTTLLNICRDCMVGEEICLKTTDFHTPICVKIRDARDPSGCGGLCELNIQHCRKLHSKIEVYQCIENRNILRCPDDNFNCGNMCIPRNKRCDGIVNCVNMADEKNCDCNLNNYFHCGGNTSCIEKGRKCNGIIDCWDRSDEIDCTNDCTDDEQPCLNGQCIRKLHFCDGVYHCKDKSDEPEGC